MLKVYQTEIPKSVVKYIEEFKGHLTPDYSNYAKGRYRAWIGLEAPLTDRQKFKETPFDYDTFLWGWLHDFCNKNLSFNPEIGLLHVGGADCSDPEENPTDGRGGECGIKEHRDAGYADYEAVGINITGEAVFGYRAEYPGMGWSKEKNKAPQLQLVKMVPGTCVVFNCKNPHFAQVGPNRWCINAWRISHKRRVDFQKSYFKGFHKLV